MDQESLWEVTVRSDWCKKCGLCIEFCPREVLRGPGVPKVADEKRCTGCRMCEMHCPDFAVTVKRREDK